MAKFRVKMKLQGLELGIEGSREDASLLSQNIGAQVAGRRSHGTCIQHNRRRDVKIFAEWNE